jgi:uncharacterized delta-60 repeat protein
MPWIRPILALFLLMLLPPVAEAAPGDLDPSFGDGGRVTISPRGLPGSYNDVAIQPDGKIVLVGYTVPAAPALPDMAITRLNADGTPDNDFGTGGTVLLNVNNGAGPGRDIGYRGAVLANGKIIVAGTSESGSVTEVTVARLNPTGTLDTTFGRGGDEGDGIARPRAGTPKGLAIDSDGRILLAGKFTPLIGADPGNSFLAGLNADGSDMTAFAQDSSSFAINMGGNDGLNGLALDPSGAIIAGGELDGDGKDAGIVRFVPGASGLDDNFGVAGKRVFGQGPGSFDYTNAVAIEPSGKIDAAGYGTPDSNFTLTRLTPTGELDPSLDGKSSVNVDFGGDDGALDIALTASGKILLVGADDTDLALARFQPGGVLDDTFGSGGKKTINFPGTTFAGASAVALQADGKIVLAGGASGGKAIVARLNGDEPSAGGGPGGGGGGGGGGGSKAYRCGGKRATIVGTNKRNKLKGTRRADVIVGLGGNDTISGLGGNDIVCGGKGNDKISGGAGKDKLYGDSGNDRLSGDAGNDRESGGSGNDKLLGGSGKDVLGGGSGRDSLSGGPGNDKLNGNSGKDKLNGGPGKDGCAGRDRKASC